MMHQKEIFKKIGAIIAELTEQYQYLSENPEQLNDLELELFAANSDFLAEHVKVLKKINLSTAPKQEDSQPKSTPVIAAESKTDPAPVAAAIAEPFVEHIKEEPAEVPVTASIPEPVQEQPVYRQEVQENTFQESHLHQNPVHQQPVLEQQQEPHTQPEPQPEVHSYVSFSEDKPAVAEAPVEPVIETPEPVVKEVVIPEKIASVEVPVQSEPVQSEPVQQAAPTLNDIIFAQRMQGNTPEPQYNKQPITDLKSAINLNDKLLFIKDLFNGYSLAYSEAIELLNRFESFSVAETFLKANYAVKNNWASKQGTVDKFYEILNRRYSK